MRTIKFLFILLVILGTNMTMKAQDYIEDDDKDTKVETERTADDDIIRFRIEGTDAFQMKNRTLEVLNSGNSVFIGQFAGANDDLSSNNNLFIGRDAGTTNTTGDFNVGMGFRALRYNLTGSSNLALGANCLENSLSKNNVGMGSNAMRFQTTGANNVGLGLGAGYFNQTGSRNVFIGTNAGRGGALHNKTGSVFIGYNAGYNEESSDKLYIANSSTATPLIWGDFSSEIVNINGRLGIDNDSPNEELDIMGEIDMEGPNNFIDIISTSTSLNGIRFYDSGIFDGALFYDESAETVSLSNSSGSDGLTVDFVSNNVGIGTNSPDANLHILNNSTTSLPQLHLEEVGNDFARLQFGSTTNNGFWHIAGRVNATASKMNFYFDDDGAAGANAGTNIMTIDGANSRVGIGNSSPGNKFEVNGGLDGGSQFVSLELTDATGLLAGYDILEVRAPTTAADGVNLIEAQRGSSIVFQVNADGNTDVNGLLEANTAAIGTTSVPGGYLFAVNGKGVMEELLIADSDDWPDYVFAKDYDLKSLAEVEASINANGHLPGVPSATEVEAEGISSGKMHKVTMEKVEELTLYAIDADKKIKALDKENTELKNTLEELVKRVEQLEKK